MVDSGRRKPAPGLCVISKQRDTSPQHKGGYLWPALAQLPGSTASWLRRLCENVARPARGDSCQDVGMAWLDSQAMDRRVGFGTPGHAAALPGPAGALARQGSGKAHEGAKTTVCAVRDDAAAIMCWLIDVAACRASARHVRGSPVNGRGGGQVVPSSFCPLRLAAWTTKARCSRPAPMLQSASSGQATGSEGLHGRHHEQKNDDAGSFGCGD